MDAAYYDCFKKGFRVEVCFDEVGFRGSWYTATILETPSKKSLKIFLEFDTLMEDEVSKKPLRQHVDYFLVRPLPPRESNPIFHLDDDVDAFHNDGWWEGVITLVHHARHNRFSRPSYSVFFRSSREQLEFSASELRFHREWLHGEWVPPLKENAALELQKKQTTHPLTLSAPEASSISSPTKS